VNDNDKTKEQLIKELASLRRHNLELVKILLDEDHDQVGEILGASQELLEMIFDAAPT